MHVLLKKCRQLLRDETGVTSIEYALLGALIAVAIAGSVGVLGTQVQSMYESIQIKVRSALS